MKLIPGKYCFADDGSIDIPSSEFRIPIWDYIEMNLNILNKDETYLLDLFDITKTTLYKWKRLKDDGISRDKLVVLANLFGVSLDQLYERDFNDAFQYEDFYGLMRYQAGDNYKKLTYNDLHWLFQTLNEAMLYIEYYSLGYIPLKQSDNSQDNEYNRIGFNSELVEYFCKNLSINVSYDTKDGYKHFVNSISFIEVCEISKILESDWKDEAHKHITTKYNESYYKMILLTENIEFLNYAFNQWNVDINYFLKLWLSIKETTPDFDLENLVIKLILSKGARFFDNEENIDTTRTMTLIDEIFSDDIKRCLNRNKEEK